VEQGQEILPLWECIVDDGGHDKFVGDKRVLSCSGAEGIAPLTNKLEIITSNVDQKHLIKKLNLIKSTENSADILITSYKPGEYSDLDLMVIGDLGAFRTNVSIKTKSILTKEMKEPFPSMGPIYPTYPKWLIFAGLFVLLILLASVTKFIFSKYKRRNYILDIKKKYTPVVAYNNFARDIRKWRKTSYKDMSEQFEALNIAWNNYLTRSLYVDISDVSTDKAWRKVLNVIKKENFKLYKLSGKKIKLAVAEMKSAKKDKEKLSQEELSSLCKQLLQVSEEINNYHRGKS